MDDLGDMLAEPLLLRRIKWTASLHPQEPWQTVEENEGVQLD